MAGFAGSGAAALATLAGLALGLGADFTGAGCNRERILSSLAFKASNCCWF